MITFDVENLDDCLQDILLLLDAHFEEIAINKQKLKYANMDTKAYYVFEKAGQLHIITARSAGKLVGYYVAFVYPHLHYAHILTALVDVYYLMPEHRKGSTGIKLFQYAEKTLKARGVERILSGTKMHKDMGRLFEYLGWTETERLYSKWIGD